MSDTADLQFDRAQFDETASPTGCTVCKTPLQSSYFEVNGNTVCERCCYTLKEATPPGTRAGRALRAVGAGIGAGLAGAILYWGILAATGYEFGLIAIVVGYAVGKAVRWGSGNRGGRAYQAAAIALTYFAIVSSYIPIIVTEIMKEKPAAQAQEASGESAVVPVAASTSTPAEPDAGTPERGTFFKLVFGLAALFLIACAAPFLAGVQNVIGLVIIGIGMYEAWKLNRRIPLEITGPHALAPSRLAAAGQ